MAPSLDMTPLLLMLVLVLVPYTALAGGSVSASIKDLGSMSGIESLNIQGATVLLSTECVMTPTQRTAVIRRVITFIHENSAVRRTVRVEGRCCCTGTIDNAVAVTSHGTIRVLPCVPLFYWSMIGGVVLP